MIGTVFFVSIAALIVFAVLLHHAETKKRAIIYTVLLCLFGSYGFIYSIVWWIVNGNKFKTEDKNE